MKKLASKFTSFTPTEQSPRTVKTFGEVRDFKRQLITAQKTLIAYKKSTDELVKVIDTTATAFPRIWTKGLDGSVNLRSEDVVKPVPAGKLQTYPSTNDINALTTGLKEQVHDPIEAWHRQYQTVKVRLEKVDAARTAYDNARKQLVKDREAALKQQRKTDGQAHPDITAATESSSVALDSARQHYLDIEEEVYQDLVHLAVDAQNCRLYMESALQLHATALTGAAGHYVGIHHSHVGAVPQRLALPPPPGSSGGGSAPGTPSYGANPHPSPYAPPTPSPPPPPPPAPIASPPTPAAYPAAPSAYPPPPGAGAYRPPSYNQLD